MAYLICNLPHLPVGRQEIKQGGFISESKSRIKKLILKRVSLTLFFCLLTYISVFAQTELSISSAITSNYYGSHTASKAIDNNLTTCWRGKAAMWVKTPWWLKLDLSSAKSLTQISIFWNKDYGSTNYNIQASNDGSTWANLYTALSSTGGTTNPYQKDYTLTGSYRYLRLYLNKAQKSYPIIYEVKLYEGDTAPQIISISPADGSTFYENDTVLILPNVKHTGTSALEYQFSVDSNIKQAWSSQTGFSWITASGIHNLKVEVKNNLGQDSKQVEVYVFKKPISPPQE